MDKQNQTREKRPASAAKKNILSFSGLLLLLALLFWAGSWYGQTKGGSRQGTGSRNVLYYVDPMNPAHTSAEPGLAPCGMKMEPVFADDAAQPAGPALPPGSVRINSEKQQMIGVRVAKAEKAPWTHRLRTVGKVAVDEARVYRLNAYADGWIVKVYDNSTGSLVRKDEPLAKYYNRDLAAALQTFYYTVDSLEQIKQGGQGVGSQEQLLSQQMAAAGVLMNLGMRKRQLDELARSKKLTQEVIISAPVTSFVVSRTITQGQRFEKGEEFYRLADLSQVWVVADIYKNEAKFIHMGEAVQVTMPQQEETFEAKVAEILPQFDTTTLTLKVRLTLANPDFDFKPGMFVDVEFPITMPESLNVPTEAVMDSGVKKIVFVDRGNGFFEPRRVKTGWRLGDRVEIIAGLQPGEQIVTSGNFFIDSESRIKLAAEGISGNVGQDPVCGRKVDTDKANTTGLKSEIQGQSYYFCSHDCKKQFEISPERYLTQDRSNSPGGGAKSTKMPVATAKDPTCGLQVPMTTARESGRISEYQGKTYYFDTDGCKQRFDQDPQSYLTAQPEDILVPPNPYEYRSKLQSDPASQLQFRRKILRAIPQVQSQPVPFTQAPGQSAPGAPGDAPDAGQAILPPTNQLRPELPIRAVPQGPPAASQQPAGEAKEKRQEKAKGNEAENLTGPTPPGAR